MSNQQPPRNRRAFAALDAEGQAYVVLEPVDADQERLPKTALLLSSSATFAHAEQLAADFNSGERSGFAVLQEQVLTGDDIPPLFTDPERKP